MAAAAAAGHLSRILPQGWARRMYFTGEPIDEGYQLEQECTLRLGATADAREAIAAFREKRAPVWTGQ